jgi:DNA topoisomerase-1
MTRGLGWARKGSSKRGFRYCDGRGREIEDPSTIERIAALAIPPAWKDVRISPRPAAKLQATGVDRAGRRQYLYHPSFRAAQEEAKFERLIRFGERLPDLRSAMAEDMDADEFDPARVCAIALRLIDHGWFRVGNDRYARSAGTYGITTLTRRHVDVRGHKISLRFPTKGKAQVRTTIVDDELATALRDLLRLPGGRRVFRYRFEDRTVNLTSRRLNEYVKEHLGAEFTAKDFRTWGGTLTAAIAFAERAARDGYPETTGAAKRSVTAVMRRVAEQLGNTPSVARSSYVSPAVIDQYLEGRTLADFRPRHLRVVRARDIALSPEEVALLSLLRSARIRRARAAA